MVRTLQNSFQSIRHQGSCFVFSSVQQILNIIDGLQPIPKDSVNKGVAAMLVEQTKEVLDKSFVDVHQHGGGDVT